MYSLVGLVIYCFTWIITPSFCNLPTCSISWFLIQIFTFCFPSAIDMTLVFPTFSYCFLWYFVPNFYALFRNSDSDIFDTSRERFHNLTLKLLLHTRLYSKASYLEFSRTFWMYIHYIIIYEINRDRYTIVKLLEKCSKKMLLKHKINYLTKVI